ncbi:MAG TPA: GNAT family N-acetyltransferase [Acidimicrobiales bacterium]|nr:GNAT family N-acetyltransferase [Acidimicrobiales bacterium]
MSGGGVRPPSVLSDGTVELRPFTAADVAAVTAACQDPEIARWTASIPWPYTEEDARSWIATHEEGWARGTAAEFAVAAASDGRLLGSLGFRPVDRVGGTAGVGYWVAAPARGRGVATAALVLGTRWALQTVGLAMVELVTMIGNVASERVAQKAGFAPVGEIADYEHPADPHRRFHVQRWQYRRGR